MSVITNLLRAKVATALPERLVNWGRDWKWRFTFSREFLAARRCYGETSRLADALALLRSYVWPPKTILFYPQPPTPRHLSFRMCAVLGYRMTSNPNRRFDVAFKRKGATFFDAALLDELAIPRSNLVNGSSLDVSKRHVGEVFESIFGYPVDVEPTRYEGLIVEKSNLNATKDARILKGPLAPDEVSETCVYEKAIDNASIPLDLTLDYRVPIHGQRIPLVYLKYRHIESRFHPYALFVDPAEPEKAFSVEEREKLLRFASDMGIDYGELDVLRDADGRIYVIDAANTPGGPPHGLSDSDARRVMARLAKSFDQLMDDWIARTG